jgi:hypothetical protein
MILREALTLPDFRALRDVTRGIVFLSTPHFSTVEAWGRFGKDVTTLLKDQSVLTTEKTSHLSKINERFDSWLPSKASWAAHNVCCVSEELPVYRLGWVSEISSFSNI